MISPKFFCENRNLLGFEGVWALREIPAPIRQTKSDPEKIGNILNFFSRCGFKKYGLVKNGAIRFPALGAPYRGRVH